MSVANAFQKMEANAHHAFDLSSELTQNIFSVVTTEYLLFKIRFFNLRELVPLFLLLSIIKYSRGSPLKKKYLEHLSFGQSPKKKEASFASLSYYILP